MQRPYNYRGAAITQSHEQAGRLLLLSVRCYCGRHIDQNPQDGHHGAYTSATEPERPTDQCWGWRTCLLSCCRLLLPHALAARQTHRQR